MSLRYFFCPSLTWTIKLEPTRKSLVGILNCCKYKLCLRVKTSCQTSFILNIAFQKNLYLVSFISFSVDYAMNPTMMNM